MRGVSNSQESRTVMKEYREYPGILTGIPGIPGISRNIQEYQEYQEYLGILQEYLGILQEYLGILRNIAGILLLLLILIKCNEQLLIIIKKINKIIFIDNKQGSIVHACRLITEETEMDDEDLQVEMDTRYAINDIDSWPYIILLGPALSI